MFGENPSEGLDKFGEKILKIYKNYLKAKKDLEKLNLALEKE